MTLCKYCLLKLIKRNSDIKIIPGSIKVYGDRVGSLIFYKTPYQEQFCYSLASMPSYDFSTPDRVSNFFISYS